MCKINKNINDLLKVDKDDFNFEDSIDQFVGNIEEIQDKNIVENKHSIHLITKILSGIFAIGSLSGYLILIGAFFKMDFILNIPVIGKHPFMSAILIVIVLGVFMLEAYNSFHDL